MQRGWAGVGVVWVAVFGSVRLGSSSPPGLTTRLRSPSPAPCKQPCRNSPLESQLSGEGLAASAPGLELTGRCLIRLECVPGAGKLKAECLIVCVCGCVPAGLMGQGFNSCPPPFLCGCASQQAADPGLFAGSGPASWVSWTFHPGFLRPGLAAEPVITPGRDATASPVLTLLGRSLALRRAVTFLLLREVGPTCRSHHKHLPTPTRCRALQSRSWVRVRLCTSTCHLRAHLP